MGLLTGERFRVAQALINLVADPRALRRFIRQVR